NALLAGMVPALRARLRAPVLCSLQGDDIFLEALTPAYRDRSLRLVRELCRQIDGFIATSAYYADFMAGYLDLPRDKVHVVHPGLNLHGHGDTPPQRDGLPFTVGYFARICPEK